MTAYRGVVTRDGNMLLKVTKDRACPMPGFPFAPTNQPLPFQWRETFYGQWVVAYVILWDATGAQHDLAQMYAADFAKEVVAKQSPERWEIPAPFVRQWIVDKCSADIMRPR